MNCYHCFQTIQQTPCPLCGYNEALDPPNPSALPRGSILAGQYIVGHVLHQDDFFISYLAWDNQTSKRVVMREFFPKTIVKRVSEPLRVEALNPGCVAKFRYGLQCFLEETQKQALLNGLPCVAQLYRYFESFGTAYYSMEYVEGITLKEYLQNKRGYVSWRLALRTLAPVAQALSAIHAKGVLHGNINPETILILKKGQVKVLDFGIIRYRLREFSSGLDGLLTPGYAAKEQYMRRGLQGAYTDVYALCACLYTAVSGKVPPEALDRLGTDSLEPLSDFALPSGLEDVILKGMSVQIEPRFPTMEALSQAMDPSAFSHGLEKKSILGALLGCTLLVGMVGAGLWMTGYLPWGHEEISFSDPALQQAIALQIPLPPDEIDKDSLASITTLNLTACNISDVSVLQHCTQLEVLYLGDNAITDVSPLAALTQLKLLDLGNNAITDVSPLAALTQLESLALQGNDIADLSCLSALDASIITQS